MYRVEVKERGGERQEGDHSTVPNVPCGVERPLVIQGLNLLFSVFLMYRVELKAPSLHCNRYGVGGS